jgi:hypothetical protein
MYEELFKTLVRFIKEYVERRESWKNKDNNNKGRLTLPYTKVHKTREVNTVCN